MREANEYNLQWISSTYCFGAKGDLWTNKSKSRVAHIDFAEGSRASALGKGLVIFIGI